MASTTKPTSTADVVVIGAGPSGMIMANLLARSGVNVRILDKKDGPSLESRAIMIHAKTLELLDKIDLVGKAAEKGRQLLGVRILVKGKPAGTLSFGGTGLDKLTPLPYGILQGQDETEQILLEDLEKVCRVEWGTELLSMEQSPDNVRVRVRNREGNEETIQTQWLIGADGTHSPVRRALKLEFAGESYAQSLFVADIDMESEPHLQQDTLHMELHGHGFFFFVPLRPVKRFRLFAMRPQEMSEKNTMTAELIQSLLDAQSGIRVKILKAHWTAVWKSHQRLTSQFRVGRAFLVGDSGHIHSPAGGQGMNTGMGDAYNLATKLAYVVKKEAHETLLDSYEAERMPFARDILKGTDTGFRALIKTKGIFQLFKMFIFPLIFGLLSRLSFFRRGYFMRISQLMTSYRDSPAVEESGQSGKQGPRAGDRAPYGHFEQGPNAGMSLFTLLKGLDHHLLFFHGNTSASDSMNLKALEKNLLLLLEEYKVPIAMHAVSAGNKGLHKAYGVGDKAALFLVRPDGHVAYRGPGEDLDAFTRYLDRIFIRIS